MPLIETDGIILRSYPLADADRIVVFYTRDHGLVRGVAKGAKRLKSKFGGGLEPFTQVSLKYFLKEERELVTISETDVTRSYFAEASDPIFLSVFSTVCDWVIQLVLPSDSDERIFRLTKASLETGSDHPGRLFELMLYFEVWLLKFLGYLPDWSRCSNCKTEFPEAALSHLQTDFQLRCIQCGIGPRREIVDPATRKLMANCLRLSPVEFVKGADRANDDFAALTEIIGAMLKAVSGKDSDKRQNAVKY